MHWPALQSDEGRGVRRSPLLPQLRVAGAAVGEAAGWERAAWFEPGATVEPLWIYDFDRPSWFGPVGEEMRATREGVALFDLSTYAKFLVRGPEAVAGLQRLCTSNVDVAIGRVVYTLLCNERGGHRDGSDRHAPGEDRFLVLAPTLYQRRTEMLLRNGLPAGATVTDVTGGYATLHVAGPDSRAVLAELTDQDLSNEAFPFLSSREIDLGWAKAIALRVSFTGELGWELLVPSEFAGDVYDKVEVAGAPHDMRHAGAFAFDALRLERGFRSWGHDIGVARRSLRCGPRVRRPAREGRVRRQGRAGRVARCAARSRARQREAGGPGPDVVARGARGDRQGAARPRDQRGVRPPPGCGRRARVGPRRVSPPICPVASRSVATKVRAMLSREPFYDPTGDRLRDRSSKARA